MDGKLIDCVREMSGACEGNLKLKELRRLAGLDAMGIQSYVSRRQMPGAALTRRLAVRRLPVSPAVPVARSFFETGPEKERAPGLAAISGIEASPSAPAPRRAAAPQAEPLRFSLATVLAGNWLWLEEVNEGALAAEQLQLIQAMAWALSSAGGAPEGERTPPSRPEVQYFNWPLNNSRQLDQGEDAARSGVAGFIRRRLELRECQGLVMLGEACATRVPLELVDCARVVSVTSTASMLADSMLKKQVWQELQAICLRS